MQKNGKPKLKDSIFMIGLGSTVGATLLYLLILWEHAIFFRASLPLFLGLYQYLSYFLYFGFLILLPILVILSIRDMIVERKILIKFFVSLGLTILLPLAFLYFGGGGFIAHAWHVHTKYRHKNKTFYVTYFHQIFDPNTSYEYYKCNSFGGNCTKLTSSSGSRQVLPFDWYVDEPTDTLYMFHGGDISIIYDLKNDQYLKNLKQIYLDGAENEKYIISIYAYMFEDGRNNLFMSFWPYEVAWFDEEVTLFSYAWYDFEQACEVKSEPIPYAQIMRTTYDCEPVIFIDEETLDFQIIINGNLIYTYEDEPTCQIDECLVIRESLEE